MVTRPLRDNDPKNYTHVSKQEFEAMRSQNKFLSITENPYTDVD
jgi:guanylate kinase